MKDKILIFIIGLLVGAIITGLGFLIYQNINKNTDQIPSGEQMRMMERPNGEIPPEKPSGTENNENSPEPPSNDNSSTDNKIN